MTILGLNATIGDHSEKALAPMRHCVSKRAIGRLVSLFSSAMLLAAGARAQTAAPTYQITSTTPASIAAGAAGASLALAGTFPDFSQSAYKVCFYTGSGSTAPITPTVTAGVPTIAVPATTIQAIPASSFTATNGYAVQGLVSIAPTGTTCDGTYTATLTNSFAVPIAEPVLTAYAGPSSVPQTNSVTGLQAPPTAITLLGTNFAANTTVAFGTFAGAVTRVLTPTSLSVSVPAAFAASSLTTAATLTVCNSGSGTTTFCSTQATPFQLTLASLYPSTGTLTASPSPVTTSGQTTLSAKFSKGSPANALPEPGAPSGTVTFTAGSATIPAAPLVLDTTATFVQKASTVTPPTAPTPTISPAAGALLNSGTINITDSTTGAAIYYTQDGSTPTSASTAYTGPFQISTAQTVKAIATAQGVLPSAVASSAYTITVSPPAQLAFVAQPISTGPGAALTPPVQVAIQDRNGVTVNNSVLPVTLSLGGTTTQATLGGTLTVNAVNGIATFSDLTVGTLGTGYVLNAASGQLTPSTSSAFNITPFPITLTVQSALIGINSTLNGTVTLGHAAPSGGTVVTLTSSTPANATISPASITIPQGQTTGAFTYTGVAAGSSTLSGSATNYATGTVTVTGTAAQVSLGTIPAVAPGQMASLALSLYTAAPAGGTTVTFTSSNPNVATVTSSILVPAGQRTASTNPQITGVTIGTTTITASAPGFAPDTRTANVTVVASFNPTSTSINLATVTTTTLNISAPAPVGGIAFTLSSDDTTKVTVSPNVTIAAGTTSVPISITGVANGSTTIRADSTGVTEATLPVTVNSTITPNQNVTTGVNLENSVYFYLPVTPSVPTTVTVTISAPGVATLSTSATTAGTATVSFPNVTTAGYVGPIYVQGLSVGTATITAAGPGYTSGTSAVTVDPSGFSFYYNNQTFSTTTFSSPTSLTIYPVVLSPGSLSIIASLQVNPGVSAISVPVTSSATGVGTITTSPVVFHGGETSLTTNFQPVSAGTATITMGVPAGYSTPASSLTETATVSAPVISANQNVTTGVNQQGTVNFYLPVAPPTPVTVTVTTSAPGVTTLSKSASVVGTTSVTFTNVTYAGYVGTIYVQGQSLGTATLTASAPGYTSGTSTVTVDATGFGFYYNGQTFSTTTFSGPTTLNVYPLILNPTTFAVLGTGQLNPGLAPISVPVTSSATAVGTITTSPVVFNPGDSSDSTSFQPAGAGTATLTVGAVAGYSTPASSLTETATVSAPAISANQNVTTGVNQQGTVNFYLPVAPPTPVTVTVTTSAPATATLSKSATVVGTSSVTFTNVSSAGYVGTIYVQGQALGSATLTASAPGYTSGTSTVTVDSSGFGFYYNNQTISTTTFSSVSGLTVYPLILTPGTLTVIGTGQVNPGLGTISVPVTSSATSVGTITTSPVVFNPGDTSESSGFQPLGAGTATLTVGTPVGYSTAASNTTETANVTAPVITANQNVTTGVNMQGTVNFYLPVAPPNPVTVTVTSNGPVISTLSKSATVVGTNTVTFTNVTAAGYVGTIYVQGQSVGSTTVTASAPGYTNGSSNVTVDPSGFGFYYNNQNFTTTSFSGPTNLTVYPLILAPSTLTIVGTGQLNPGASVSVPVTSSATSVATITTSPVVFNGGDTSQNTSFQPQGNGTATFTVGTPVGYSTPSSSTTATATVSSPVITSNQNVLTGVSLQGTVNFYLPVAPPSPVTVTITSSGPGVATLSKSASVVGGSSLTYSNVSSAGYLGTIYVQGQSVGSTTITGSAPGYTSGTSTVTVDPSGFGFNGNQSFSTTTFSSPNALTIYPIILNPGTLTVAGTAQVNPGLAAISVPVTSSTTSVGTITTSPVVFHGGESYLQTSFQPQGNGMSTVSITEPSGFSTPSDSNQTAATATVSAPVITANQNVITGVNLQGTVNFYLPQTPPSPVTVTVTIDTPASATLSTSATTVGGTTVTYTNVSSAGYLGTIYVQGQAMGNATITATASGYTSGTSTVAVYPSAISFYPSSSSFNTTSTSSPTTLYLYTNILNPGSLTVYNYGLPLNPGLGTVSIPVTSSATSVGTITTSPVVFKAGDTYNTTTFKPVATGTSNITVGSPPTGFSTPSQTQYNQITATVQ